jgi:hypothetical protein
MTPASIHGMFNFTYEKSAESIISHMIDKIYNLKDKIKEREGRIMATRVTYGIDDEALIEIMKQVRTRSNATSFSYSVKGNSPNESPRETSIGAGVINMIMTESDFIEAEKKQIHKLELISNNLENKRTYEATGENGREELVMRGHNLSLEEMEYLGY